MTPELKALKSRLRATWIAGDFGQIAKSSASGAEVFVKRLNLQPGMKVLDVACGTGNLALPAARMGAIVTGDGISKLETKPRRISLTFPFSPGEVVEHFRNYFGPTQKAFSALDESGQAALRRDLERLWTENNQATDGTTQGESEYLEVIAVRG